MKNHGQSKPIKTGAHRSWSAMKRRVKTDPNYAHVTICDRWLGRRGFINFYEDMGDRPKGLTLHRRLNSLGYEPDNCEWATIQKQNSNTRQNVTITLDGETRLITEWCRLLGVSYKYVWRRQQRGMSLKDALTKPKGWSAAEAAKVKAILKK